MLPEASRISWWKLLLLRVGVNKAFRKVHGCELVHSSHLNWFPSMTGAEKSGPAWARLDMSQLNWSSPSGHEVRYQTTQV